MTNEPVVANGLAAILAAVLAPLLAKWGVDAAGTTKLVGLVLSAGSLAVAGWRVWAARSKVTPIGPPSIGTTTGDAVRGT